MRPEHTERIRAARLKAWRAGSALTSQQAMERMWKNGSDRKQNPFLTGEIILIGSELQQKHLRP